VNVVRGSDDVDLEPTETLEGKRDGRLVLGPLAAVGADYKIASEFFPVGGNEGGQGGAADPSWPSKKT
jgi:hypothetical protein